MNDPKTLSVERGADSCAAPCSAIWDRAVDTLSCMCIDEKLGQGPTKKAFILTLRLYADEMEKLLSPNSVIGTNPATKDKL